MGVSLLHKQSRCCATFNLLCPLLWIGQSISRMIHGGALHERLSLGEKRLGGTANRLLEASSPMVRVRAFHKRNNNAI